MLLLLWLCVSETKPFHAPGGRACIKYMYWEVCLNKIPVVLNIEPYYSDNFKMLRLKQLSKLLKL